MIKITHRAEGVTLFFEKILGAKLKNPQWSWGAKNLASNQVFLKIWNDLPVKDNKVQVYWKDYDTKSNGKPERLEHLDAIKDGATAIGVVCEVNRNSENRKTKFFDDKQLLLLGGLSKNKKGSITYARIRRRFPISELPALFNDRIDMQNSAIDDIPSAPIGSEVPGRTPTAGSRYQRNEKVRRLIIKQAKGVCEYCRKPGFPLPDGDRYLEAHHIIALAKQGPDKVENVIALCPSDHREAHYGANADKLETEMKEIIRNRNARRGAV